MRSLILPDSKPRVTIQKAANLVECRATRIQRPSPAAIGGARPTISKPRGHLGAAGGRSGHHLGSGTVCQYCALAIDSLSVHRGRCGVVDSI